MTEEMLRAARAALAVAPAVGDEAYRTFVAALRVRMSQHWDEIIDANQQDLARSRERGVAPAMLDRMRLTSAHHDALDRLTRQVEENLPHEDFTGPQTRGIGASRARRILRPLGVILMIYEARPTVTVDSAAMSVSTGNAVLLRGGHEIAVTNRSLAQVIGQALRDAGLPHDLVHVLEDTDRAQLRELLRRSDAIDVVIPRGSPSLIDYCRSACRIPMIVGGGGVNHLYVHHSADPGLAAELTLDSKLPDPAGCTALEMVLVDDAAVEDFLAALGERIDAPDAEGFVLRVPETLVDRVPTALKDKLDDQPLASHDDGREFLDLTLALRSVPDLDAAVRHIQRFGSGHTEGIVSNSPEVIRDFCRRVDAAAIVSNGSLRLHDAPSLGLGAELAISTDRLHVRGPVTLDALFTYSWVVDGGGSVRFRNTTARPEQEV